MGECSASSSLQADSKVKFAAWPASWRWPTLAQMNHSELSHMAGAVDDSTINIVEVIIIIIIGIIIALLILNLESLKLMSKITKIATKSKRAHSANSTVSRKKALTSVKKLRIKILKNK